MRDAEIRVLGAFRVRCGKRERRVAAVGDDPSASGIPRQRQARVLVGHAARLGEASGQSKQQMTAGSVADLAGEELWLGSSPLQGASSL